jgi:AcrR family transcriptional regulator
MRVLSPAKREEILALASQVFAEVGYERASMAEISARVGGSKATLYRYFPSKKDLFLEVASNSSRQHFGDSVLARAHSRDEVVQRLYEIGLVVLPFLLSPDTIARERMVIAESGQSDIGLHFFANGPAKGLDVISEFLQHAVDDGWLRPMDTRVAAAHLLALWPSEIEPQRLFGVPLDGSPAFLQQVVARAVDVFMRAYAI